MAQANNERQLNEAKQLIESRIAAFRVAHYEDVSPKNDNDQNYLNTKSWLVDCFAEILLESQQNP